METTLVRRQVCSPR